MELYNRRLLLLNGDDHEPYSIAAYAPPSSPLLRSPLKLPAPSDLDPDVAYTILILLAALLFLAFISLYIRRFADDSLAAGRHRSSSLCGGGLDPITIQSLPVFAYQGESKDHVDCAICLTQFQHGEAVKIIPNCSHMFHPECVDTWLVSHVTCPICRGTTFLTVDNVEQSGDQGLNNHQGQSTVDNEDGRVSLRSHSQRRSYSCSSFRDKLVLPRTLSY